MRSFQNLPQIAANIYPLFDRAIYDKSARQSMFTPITLQEFLVYSFYRKHPRLFSGGDTSFAHEKAQIFPNLRKKILEKL